MPIIWVETTPRFFYLKAGGFVDITITSKIPNVLKPFRQNVLFQVGPDTFPGTVADTYGAPPTDFAVIRASALKPDPEASRFVSGLADDAAVLVISSTLMSDFVSNRLITPQRSMQVSGVVYRKIEFNFMNSKRAVGIAGPATKKSLMEYAGLHVTLPASLSGDIAANSAMVVGALGISQYAGTPVSPGAESITRIQQDRPGRYLIRGCGITEAQALTDSRVDLMLTNLREGSSFVAGQPYGMTPVIDILGDIWSVRATQSAGYVRVAAQRGKNPAGTVEPGGAV